MKPLLAMLAVLALSGCGQPVHMQYDFGRANAESFARQADRSRESVQDVYYPLTGAEAEAMRKRVQESTTDKESGEVSK